MIRWRISVCLTAVAIAALGGLVWLMESEYAYLIAVAIGVASALFFAWIVFMGMDALVGMIFFNDDPMRQPNMQPIHHLKAEDVEIRLAEGTNGVQIELRADKINELKYLLSRALNTADPQKAPQWAVWLADRL